MELWSGEVEAMRAEARETAAAAVPFLRELLGLDSPPDPDGDVVTRVQQMREAMDTIGGADAGTAAEEIAGVRCRVFRNEGPARAIYVHLHGGGMIAGTAQMADAANRALAHELGATVISIDYRLAPEHPHPAPVDDAVAVLVWLLEGLGSPPGAPRIVLGGESAGAYVAVAALLRVRDQVGVADGVAGIELSWGIYDWGRSPSQRGVRSSESPDLLSPEGLAFSAGCYLPDRSDDERRDPAVSPAYADLRSLPPAFFAVGTADHLLDDTLTLAARWVAAGNRAELFVAPDLPHAFSGIPCAMTDAWSSARLDWLHAVIGAASGPRPDVSRRA